MMTDFKSGSCRRYLLESERPPVPPSPLSTGPDGEKCCSRTPGSSAFFAEGPFKAGEGGEGGGWPTLAQWESGLTRQQPAMQGCQTRTADASLSRPPTFALSPNASQTHDTAPTIVALCHHDQEQVNRGQAHYPTMRTSASSGRGGKGMSPKMARTPGRDSARHPQD